MLTYLTAGNIWTSIGLLLMTEQSAGVVPPELLPVEEPVALAVGDLMSARVGGVVRLYTQDANPVLYNHPLFLETARYLNAVRRVTFQVATGPILLVDDHRQNGLLTLQQEGVLDRLYHRGFRGYQADFRIVETDFGLRWYKEFPMVRSPDKERLYYNPDHHSVWAWQRGARADWDHFGYWIKEADQGANFILPRPLLLNTAEMVRLSSKVGWQKLGYLYLPEIERLAKSGLA